MFVCIIMGVKMMTFRRAWQALLAVSLTVTHMTVAEDRQELPVEAFAALETFVEPRLSPSGQKIAYFTTYQGKRAGVVQTLDGKSRVLIPPVEEAQPFQIWWANDKRLLVAYRFSTKRAVFGATRLEETRLAAIDASGENMKWIVLGEEYGRNRHGRASAPWQHQIVSILPDEPNYVLIQLDNDLDGANEVRRMNVKTGRYKVVHDDARGIQTWYADHKDRIRLGVGTDLISKERSIRIYDTKGKLTADSDAAWMDTYAIIGFSADPDVIYVRGRGASDRMSVYTLSLLSGEILDTVMTHDRVDLDYILDHPDTGIPAGVVYTEDFQKIAYFDARLKRVQGLIDGALKGRSNIIVDKARGKEIYIVRSMSDRDPGSFYWFDVKAKNLAYIAPAREPIYPEQMAATKEVMITARDGTEVPTYVTTPLGQTGAMPTVVLPHGGPYARSTAHWDFWSQFLAKRGYLVLQPNFRGSDGYGAQWRRAGYNQWGGRMQDDVTDVTHWAINEGLADARRICIVGGSYGGYAALMGAIKEPGLYACAVSLNGVTDIPHLKNFDEDFFIDATDWIKRMGLEGVEDEMVSPKHRADEISVPVMLFQARDDSRVPWRQAERTAEALDAAGKPYIMGMSELGGHSLTNAQSRLKFLTMLEAFLADALDDGQLNTVGAAAQ